MKRTKYNAPGKKKDKPCIDGYTFDSELEHRYYMEIIRGGEGKDLKVHPRYEIVPKTDKRPAVHYVADFEVTLPGGDVLVVDVKGMATETALLKRKVFEWRHPDKILWWICYSKIDGGWILYDELQKARAKRRREKKEGAGGMKPYKGMTQHCPTYQENETTRKPGSKRRKKRAKKQTKRMCVK